MKKTYLCSRIRLFSFCNVLLNYVKMRISYLLLIVLLFCAGCATVQKQKESDYVVVSGKGVATDSVWNRVVETLQVKHNAVVVTYNEQLDEVLPELQRIRPRYVAVVEKPENLNRDYIIGLNKLSRKVDNDIYADFLWGVITGYDADNAMRMVERSTEPLVVKSAVSTIMELHSGKWFDRFAWIDDHTKGLWGEKRSAEDTIITGMIDPSEVLQKFCDIYCDYDADLIVTAAHARETALEMPFSLGDIRAKDGRLYADFKEKAQFLTESGKRKVYFAVGNCLIGNVNNTRESMAIAWMNGGNATAMIGYVVTTWHGRNGWGGLKYWVTNPGRYSLAQAIYLNQQDFLNQQYEWSPRFLEIDYPYADTCGFQAQYNGGVARVRGILGEEPTNDQVGFLHDRDVLAFYGDPKWDVRLQEVKGETDFTVTSEIKGKKCVVTITTTADFSVERMKGGGFKQEHALDLPFSYFFPERLNNPRLSAGQPWKVALDENFLLIYNADFKPSELYTVEIDID